jgi:hypothetical protein
VSNYDEFTDLESETKYTIVLKGRFKALDTNNYGLFIVFLNEELRIVENLIVAVSHYSSLYEIDPSLPWYSLEEYLINMKWKGDVAVNITIDLQNYLESSLDRDRGTELYTLVRNNEHNKIESLLQVLMMKPLNDRSIQVDTLTEQVSNEELTARRAERNRPREVNEPVQESTLDVRSKNAIEVDLVLAPVSGIPVYELAEGDKIMVKINDRVPRGRHYVDLLGARVDGNVIPVPAEIVEIKRNEKNEYSILCKIDDRVYGKAIETEQVKLKKYDELLMTEQSLREFSLNEEPSRRRTFRLFIITMGALTFVILMVFIIMWFYNLL